MSHTTAHKVSVQKLRYLEKFLIWRVILKIDLEEAGC